MTAAPAPLTSPSPITAANPWRGLRRELDSWAAGGATASLWWRDDDAVDVTPVLDRLLALSADHRTPVALAVIPAAATAALAGRAAGVSILQHGWCHADHAVRPAKKAELGAGRPAAAGLAELAEGRRRLLALFGPERALPVLVPPWNRIAPAVAAGLPGLGFRGLSTFASKRFDVPGLTEANTHGDPVDWHGGGGFLGDDAVLARLIDHLRARRYGHAPRAEATGLLTHHLVMDEASWAFTARLLGETAAHPAVRWLGAAEIFGRPD